MDTNIMDLDNEIHGDDQASDPAKEALDAMLAAVLRGDNAGVMNCRQEFHKATREMCAAAIADFEARIEGLKRIVRDIDAAEGLQH